MAQELDQQTDKELEHSAKVAFGVRAIERDQNLRYLIRLHLRTLSCLPGSSVFSPDPIQNAYEQGRQAAGIDLIALLTSVVPMLWPALQLEEMQDEIQNTDANTER